MLWVAMSNAEPRFTIVLPGGKVARIPADVIMQYVEPGAEATHAPIEASDEHDDVVAHDMKQDPATGQSDYHTDWEQGDCVYTDDAGLQQRRYCWHRHPFGNDYTEVYEG